MDPLTEKIIDDIRVRYEEVDALPEPITERQHRTTSSVHDSFRYIAPVTAFNSLSLVHNAGPIMDLSQRVADQPKKIESSCVWCTSRGTIMRNHY